MKKIADLSSNAVLAKARAMYGSILTSDDYRELTNCHSINELAAYLRNRTVYSQALSSSGAVVSRARTEAAIRRFTYNRISKLASFENAIGQKLNEIIYTDFEINLILSCADHLDTNVVSELSLLYPKEFYNHTDIDPVALEKATDFNEFYHALEGTRYKKPLDVFENGNAVFSIQALENVLYSYVCKLAKKLICDNYSGEDEKELLNLFMMKSDFKMFESIFRMKKYFTADACDITKIFYTGFSALSVKEINELLACADENAFFEKLKVTKYGKLLDEKYKDHIEKCTHIAQQTANERNLRFSTCAEVVLFSYIGILENETKNIVHITEGIRYKLPAERISEYLVFGENQ